MKYYRYLIYHNYNFLPVSLSPEVYWNLEIALEIISSDAEFFKVDISSERYPYF